MRADHDDSAHAPPARGKRRKTSRKKPRGVIEHPRGSGIWWVQFFDANRRRHREKVGPKSLALQVYQKRKTEVREGRHFPKPPPVWNPTFAECLDIYLEATESTRHDVRGAARYARFWKAAPETKGKRMRDITRADMTAYRDRRKKEGAPGAQRQRGAAGPTTINKELAFVCAVFNHFIDACAEKKEPVLANPARSTRAAQLKFTESAARTRWLDHEEEARLAAVMDPTDWALVQVAIETGLDRGAQFGLRWGDVDLHTLTIHAERRKGRREGPVPVAIPITDSLLPTLRALPSRLASEWVFPNAAGTGPLDATTWVRDVFKPALLAAGIDRIVETKETVEVRAGKGVRTVEKVRRQVVRTFRWKDLRHTYATRLRLDGGADTQSIAELLGHTSTRMTERYAHARDSHRRHLVNTAFGKRTPSATTSATSTCGEESARTPHLANARPAG